MKKIVSFYIWIPIFLAMVACGGSITTFPTDMPPGNTDSPTVTEPPTQGVTLPAPATKEGESDEPPAPTITIAPPTQEVPTSISEEAAELRPISELQSDILYQIAASSGGAGGCENSVGFVGFSSETSSGSIALDYAAYRQSDETQRLWWGDKFSRHYDQLQFGDMVYFVAVGFPMDESVTYTIEGPNGRETYSSPVNYDVNLEGATCDYYLSAPAARLEWVVDPQLGAGDYTVTVQGASGSTGITIPVTNNSVPTFGAVFGKTSSPLTLGSDQKIHVVYAGFQPNETVTAILLRATNDTDVIASPVSYVETQMDHDGNGRTDILWDSSLPSGVYWLLVPNIVPQSVMQQNGVPGTWGVEFYTSDRFANLFNNIQDILLRPSCGKELTAKEGQTIHLRYGIWGANGSNILDETKDKIVTRLFISDFYSRMQEQEVIGFRSNAYLPMSQIPCGNQLANGYFLISETEIGPYYLHGSDQINIRVEYSFTDTITDGYDVSPADGAPDLYGPNSSFSQTYTITIVP